MPAEVEATAAAASENGLTTTSAGRGSANVELTSSSFIPSSSSDERISKNSSPGPICVDVLQFFDADSEGRFVATIVDDETSSLTVFVGDLLTKGLKADARGCGGGMIGNDADEEVDRGRNPA